MSDNSESLDIDSTWQLCCTLRESTLPEFKKEYNLQTVVGLRAFTKVIQSEFKQKQDKITKSLEKVNKNGKVEVKDLKNIMIENKLGEDIEYAIRDLDPKNSKIIS